MEQPNFVLVSYASSGESDEEEAASSTRLEQQQVRVWTSRGFAENIVAKALEVAGTNDEDKILDFILALQCQDSEVVAEERQQIHRHQQQQQQLEHSQQSRRRQQAPMQQQQQLQAEPNQHQLDELQQQQERQLQVERELKRAKFEQETVSMDELRKAYTPEELEIAETLFGELGDVVDKKVVEFLQCVRREAGEGSSSTSGLKPAKQTREKAKFEPRARTQVEGDYVMLKSIFGPEVVDKAIRQCGPCAPEDEVANVILQTKEGTAGAAAYRARNAATRDIGFGVPGTPLYSRQLPPRSTKGLLFYFENVKSMLRGDWEQISRFLDGIPPEFVDSKWFCAASRPRGYIHNLPVETRQLLLPRQPMTIQEMFPEEFLRYIPEWDTRTQFQCITRKIASAPKCKDLSARASLPDNNKLQIMSEIKEHNLVWTGQWQLTNLDPREVERLQGFDEGHTRCAVAHADKYRFLGSSFQVDTVAWHLSVLKPMFPHGIKVVSLFSGIGGAEVALQKLGIPIKVLVTVEKDAGCNEVLKQWWVRTGQDGVHRCYFDIRDVTSEVLEDLVHEFGHFDLVIGGSPCNNVSGMNRVSRDGLAGRESCLFFEFSRVLETLRGFLRDT